MIGIIGALEQEIEGLVKELTECRNETFASMKFHIGKLGEREVVIVQCGIGKVNAAICAQILIDRYNVQLIINTGAAGSLNNAINIGDIVISDRVVHHDMNSVKLGAEYGRVPGLPLYYEADKDISDAFEKICRTQFPEINVFRGLIASGDEFVSDIEGKKRILSNFDALCAEMEGAAIAQCAYVNNIKFLIIRAVSDKADNSAEEDFPTFLKMAGARSKKMIITLIKEYNF